MEDNERTGCGAPGSDARLAGGWGGTSRHLSDAQRRQWFLDRLEPGNPVHAIHRAMRVHGCLDTGALKSALERIVARHEALRTTLEVRDDVPMQVIHTSRSQPLLLQDLSDLPEPGREREAQRCLRAWINQGFDLAAGPLLRVGLLRLAERLHLLFISLHSVIADEGSMEVFVRELSVLYRGRAGDTPAALPEPPISYVDYAERQQQAWESGRFYQEMDYWKVQLAELSWLDLPTDRPRPARLGFAGGAQPLAVSAALTQALKALAKRRHVSLEVLLFAAFSVLLGRHAGQDDIAVGNSLPGREKPETKGMIGVLENRLMLRTNLSDDPPFSELLGRVRAVVSNAYSNRAVPFEKLVETLRIEGDLDRNPMFDVMFLWESRPRVDLKLPGLRVEALDISTGTAKFNLGLSLRDTQKGIRGSLEYRTDLFDAATAVRMAGHFETLLAGIAAKPEERILLLPLLTEAERRQWLVDPIGPSAQESPPAMFSHVCFEHHVDRNPHATAVISGDRSLSYGELDRQANQLAHQLHALGVGPDVRVGICMDRSVELIVGLFGVLKAGGALVPMEPSLPQQQLAFMFKDAGLTILLTQEHLAAMLPQVPRILCLDATDAPSRTCSMVRVENRTREDSLGFILYTSGSTGRPKGVMRYQPKAALDSDAHRFYGLGPDDRHLLKSPIGFALFVREAFCPLLTGATLFIAPTSRHNDSAWLVETIRKHGITILTLVPSQLRSLLDEKGFARCTSLRHVTTFGEILTAEDRERFFSCQQADLSVTYGTTEAPGATLWKCEREGGRQGALVGRPLANRKMLILDAHRQPVPIGVKGEIYVGGALAMGYLNHPDLTAEKFVPDPFSDDPKARLYRTGDMGRALPDGAIEFLGRIDHMVKLRGYRIELEEIEVVLRQHELVREAVVVLREASPGAPRLVAYVMPVPGQIPAKSELRRYLQEHLPEYMVSAAVVFVEDWPLTPGGKLDRKALPEPDWSRTRLDSPYAAPRTVIEERVSRIWSEVLGVHTVGIHDNFFDLGGDSLLATQVILRVNETLDLSVPMRELFDLPTVAEFSRAVTQHLSAELGDDELTALLSE